ncbi:hypothetical protein D0Z07_2215 [Hyphodiscus hymeniophilus]|uniref:Uncharacterized protein n=1 Tax=Hyphodiscus hymeniophilus TaxID=353542 RepID=A0A9P6VNH7_9HELO|nr:hypothetical protein D0Z07_2215 [Hyphodiscus hymeniophilus]
MQSGITRLSISENGVTETTETHADFKPTEPQSTAATPRNASLDQLPAELKASILYSAPNILVLQTLVRSSPLYHKVYLDERKAILSTVLLRDMGAQVLSDALAVYKASQIGFDGYVSWKEITGKGIECLGSLSSSEKRRIYRALYRFELFRVLFTEPFDIQLPPKSRSCFDAMDQSLLFLSIFKAWEVEEIACIRDYIIRRHQEILRESSFELSKLCPKKDLQDEYWQKQNTGYLMSLGLQFLCRLLNVSSAVQKASIFDGNIFCDREFLTEALEEDPYDWVYPTDTYTAAENGDELLFEDDSLVGGPNAAWPWATHQKVYVLYFEEHKEPLRKWALAVKRDELSDCESTEWAISAEVARNTFPQNRTLLLPSIVLNTVYKSTSSMPITQEKTKAMAPKPVLCTCSKRFMTNDAMLQHQRDSLNHVAPPKAPEQILSIDQLVQRLSLQDQEADHGFIPFIGGEPTTSLARSFDLQTFGQNMAGEKKPFIVAGSKPKKKKTKKGTSPKASQGSQSSSMYNPNTGQMMDLQEEQDWALCDKDCGWCGHCTEGATYYDC